MEHEKQDMNDRERLQEEHRDRLRRLILEGLESPLSDQPWNGEYFEKLRQRIRDKDANP